MLLADYWLRGGQGLNPSVCLIGSCRGWLDRKYSPTPPNNAAHIRYDHEGKPYVLPVATRRIGHGGKDD